jgi:uncharacterized protein YbcI
MTPRQEIWLEAEALERLSGALSDHYHLNYGEWPGDARASLTGNLLAFVFEGGLAVADEWLLRFGEAERLQESRRLFFEVATSEMVAIVADLTGHAVASSFYGFDPQTRTSHAIFVLDPNSRAGAEERRAVINWSQQVRLNARRLRSEHRAARDEHREMQQRVRETREASEQRRRVEGA